MGDPTTSRRWPRVGRWLPVALLVVLFAVVVAGLVDGRPSPRDRSRAVAARLRCPDCQSVSVAESDGQTARAIRADIERQVAAGRTDQEILNLFEARYGPWVLLDPPARGATLLVWMLPACALAIGLAMVLRRRRPAPPALLTQPERDPVPAELAPLGPEGPVTSGPRAALEEHKAQALGDLAELVRQVEAGEVDADTATRLRERYEAEAAAALAGLDTLAKADRASTAVASPRGRSRRRAVAGVLAGVAAIALTAAGVGAAIAPRPVDGYVTGLLPGQGGEPVSSGRDLSQVEDAEMEAVVAANPDVVGMRLALAHRYLDRGDYRRALVHYRAVLDRRPDPEALAHVGWIAYDALGRADVAARLLKQSLARRPNDREALWYLSTVQLHGLRDAKAAAATLERLRTLPGLTATERMQVDEALRLARAAAKVRR